jgi:clan AA aspartic protease (TIGR02281 family)
MAQSAFERSSTTTEAQSSNFVVLPGKSIGSFALGMTKEDMLRIAPKPHENVPDRLVYKNQKTGNILIAHFENNKIVQMDFTSKDFYTAEGIHPGNFREAQYAALFHVQELRGTSLRLKYTLKTGGLTFYGIPDPLSRAIGVVHAGHQPIYDVQSLTLEPNEQVPGVPQQRIDGLFTENIPLRKKGGIYEIPVEINGVITLHFVLDTGAAEVNIPADVALTLYRAGTIRDTDFLPGRTYTLADGSTLNSTRFLLRNLAIGNHRITDIPASIGEIASPLLLGQSFLERLGTWGIDSQKQVLTIGISETRVQRDASTSRPSIPTAQPPSSPQSKAVRETGNLQMPVALVGMPNSKVGDAYILEYLNLDNPKSSYSIERKVIAIDEGTITVAAKNVKSKTGKVRTLQFTSEGNLLSSRNPDGSGFDYAPPLKYFAFPLSPGKTWQQRSRETNIQTGAVREHTVSATVGDWEEMSVPAGTFRALKITLQTELRDPSTGETSTGTDISWYAPDVHRSVRSEMLSRDFQGKQERQVIQLMQYDVKEAKSPIQAGVVKTTVGGRTAPETDEGSSPFGVTDGLHLLGQTRVRLR